jgi:sulfite dehydrogenase (quinone) subunit SoeC
MATRELLIAPHRFAVGYFRQTFWTWLIGTAFFLGGLGSGLFLVSLLTGHIAGMIAGFLIVVVGKNTAHLLFLGRPERFLAAARRPDRSWIARGIWAMFIFSVTGFLAILVQAHSSLIHFSESAARVNSAFAVASALFIGCYDGFLMRASAGVAFWRTLLLPLLLFMYASLGGITMSLTIRELQAEAPPAGLEMLEHVLLVANAGLLVIYMSWMSRSLPAARASLHELLRGAYAPVFLGLVVVVGFVATGFLSLLHARFDASRLVILIAVSELIGDFSMMMVMLKSGLFAPQSGETCMVRRRTAREIGLDEKQSAKMYLAS